MAVKEVYLRHKGTKDQKKWWESQHELDPGFNPADGSEPIKENEIFVFKYDGNQIRVYPGTTRQMPGHRARFAIRKCTRRLEKKIPMTDYDKKQRFSIVYIAPPFEVTPVDAADQALHDQFSKILEDKEVEYIAKKEARDKRAKVQGRKGSSDRVEASARVEKLRAELAAAEAAEDEKAVADGIAAERAAIDAKKILEAEKGAPLTEEEAVAAETVTAVKLDPNNLTSIEKSAVTRGKKKVEAGAALTEAEKNAMAKAGVSQDVGAWDSIDSLEGEDVQAAEDGTE